MDCALDCGLLELWTVSSSFEIGLKLVCKLFDMDMSMWYDLGIKEMEA